MRPCLNSIVLGAILLGLACLLSSVRDQVYGQNPMGGQPIPPQVVVKAPPEPPGMICDFVTIDDPTNQAKKIRVITVVDPVSKRLCVYHEDMTLGTAKLCSVRNIQPDLMLEQFNPEKPTPQEVQESIRRFRKQSP